MIQVIKGDTRSLDYESNGEWNGNPTSPSRGIQGYIGFGDWKMTCKMKRKRDYEDYCFH